MFYKTIENPNKEICAAFEEELAKSPQKIFEQMKNYGPGKGIDTMKKLQKANDGKKPEETKKSSDEVKVDASTEDAPKEETKQVRHDEL